MAPGLVWVVAATFAAGPTPAQAQLAAQVRTIPREQEVVPPDGRSGWLFPVSELRHYSYPTFWGPAATKTGWSAHDPDPLPALVAESRAFKQAGVELIVVPIPGKVMLYGDQLKPPVDAKGLEGTRQSFLAALSKQGVEVMDILPDLRALRRAGQPPFTERDSHWSAPAVAAIAHRLAQRITSEPWVGQRYRGKASIEKVQALGRPDLATLTGRVDDVPVDVEQVLLDGSWVRDDPESPVVLVGDSNTLVFHSLLAKHGGLSDHLAGELGFPIDNVGVIGRYATTSLATLARRQDNLRGKKVAIWCFAERLLSGALKGWPIVPVVRDSPSDPAAKVDAPPGPRAPSPP